MAYDDIVLGTAANSKIIEIKLRDSTTGLGKTGLVHDSAGAKCYYIREVSLAAPAAITLGHGTASSAYNSGDFVELDATNMPGVYQLHIPNAALATGANACTIHLGFTGVIDVSKRILIMGSDLRAAALAANTTQFAGQAITCAAPVTIPTSIASPTNITAGTIETVTNLTNAPTNGDLTATMKTSAQTAANAALVANNLDHFMKTPVSDITKLGDSGGNEVPDSTVLSLMLCKGTDTDTYSHTTDSMEAVRDKLPTNLEDMSITDTTGIVKADLVSILAYTLTETGGYLAAAFKKLFNVATPVLTCESVNQTIDNPTAAAIGTDAASKVLVTPAQKIVTDGSGFVTYANAAPPAASAIKTAIEASGSHLALIKAVTDKVDTIVEVVP